MWPAILALILALGLLVCTPGLALAAGDKTEEKPNLLEPRYDLGLWSIIVFILLLLLLRKYAWGPMLEGLQKREDSIQGALDEAQKAREEAHKLRDEFAQEMAKAHEKVRDILDQGRRDAERVSTDIMAKAKTDIQSERDRLHREMQTEFEQARQALWGETAQLASLVSSKAIRRQLTPDDHRRFIDEALADLRQAGGDRHMAGTST
jgi:F-type H+-transporting ATPase subunit b